MTPLRGRRAVAFALPQFALAVLGLPVVLFLQPWFAMQPGLSLGVVGLAFALTRAWDVVTDPTLGWLGDAVGTRWGRRRFWLALGVPIMLAGIAALFLSPPPDDAVTLALWLALLYVGWTFIHMSHLSWASDIAGGYDGRTAVQGLMTGAYLAGILASLMVGAAAAQGAETPAAALEAQVRVIGWAVMALLPLACAAALLAAPEPPMPAAPPRFAALWEALAAVWRNGALRRVALADLLGGLGAGVTGASLLFIAVQHLRLPPAQAPLLILASFVSGLAFVPFWAWLARRTTKHGAMIAAALFGIATAPLVLLLPPGNFGAALAVWMVGGVNFSAPIFLTRAILGDVAEAEARAGGVDRTATFFGLLSASNKLGYALAGLAYVALELAGYRPGAATQSERAMDWLLGLYVGAPAACALGIILLMRRFPIGRTVMGGPGAGEP